jgi:hypothetical protein
MGAALKPGETAWPGLKAIVIGRPVDVVFDYVADQSNEPQYGYGQA